MFSDIVVGRGLLEFVGDSPIVAHNAAFDRGFVNHELSLAGLNLLPDARWIDSLALAQKRFPGMYNSLDALCKRFKISLAERDKHGALIDAQLLAGVYLELRGGREARLDLQHRRETKTSQSSSVSVEYGARPRPLQSRLTDSERQAHEAFIAEALKSEAVWRTRPQQA
jgi:DNA polymerase-3 subunit epsilon